MALLKSLHGSHKLNPLQAVLDYEVYFLNVSDANLRNKPAWELEYTAKVAMITLCTANKVEQCV